MHGKSDKRAVRVVVFNGAVNEHHNTNNEDRNDDDGCTNDTGPPQRWSFVEETLAVLVKPYFWIVPVNVPCFYAR